MFSGKLRAAIAAVSCIGCVIAFSSSAAWGSTTNIGPNWSVASTTATSDSGNAISQPGYYAPAQTPQATNQAMVGWLPVQVNDAGAPGGAVAAQIANTLPGPCDNAHIYFSTNINTCQGAQPDAHNAPTVAPYNSPWWFRSDFTLNLSPGQNAKLKIRGIMGQADVWVNGTQISTRDYLQGSEPEYVFDITSLVRPGLNAVALKIAPNSSTLYLNQDFNDWTQAARDANTGIKYPVKLQVSNQLQLSDAHVVENNSADNSVSDLTVKGTVTNTSNAVQTGDLDATIKDPGGATVATLHRTVTGLNPGETRVVQFDPSTDAALHIVNPQLWWPWQMGGQPLYSLDMQTSQSAVVSDTFSETFGIRTISTWLTAPGTKAWPGSRWFAVNGKPFVFRGGGLMDFDMQLRYSNYQVAHQIAIIKQMGLDGVRLEGDDQNDDFYQRMDQAGLLVYGGFLCCNKWQLSTGTGTNWSTQDYTTNYLSALALGRQQRNHPSVFMWSWSDNQPSNHQEYGVLQGFADADFNIPIMASAENKSSPILGISSLKEGPYNWFPPAYAYSFNCTGTGTGTCTSGDPVNRGGAWGFETEASPGNSMPTQDSLNRFLTPAEQTSMITNTCQPQFHSGRGVDTCQPSYSSFSGIGYLAANICIRYGSWGVPHDTASCKGAALGTGQPQRNPNANDPYTSPDMSDFLRKAQAINYETQRAYFEAFIAKSTNPDSPSTGIDYWMMNKPFPSLLWLLYGSDYDQAGSYFGVKKADESLHVFYSYDSNQSQYTDRMVNVDNLTGVTQSNLTVTATVRDINGAVLPGYPQVVNGIILPSQGVQNGVVSVPNPTGLLPGATKTYFLELNLTRGAQTIDRNVYWLSTQNDVVDFNNADATIGVATSGDLTDLQTLPAATVAASAVTHSIPTTPTGENTATDVTITNNSATVAFMTRVDVRRGTGSTPDAGDNQVRPALYSDNYVTLWPGQSQTVTESYDSAQLNGESPVVSVEGWNLATTNIAAPPGPAAKAPKGVESFGRANGAVPSGNATPGRANTPEKMASLKQHISKVRANVSRKGNDAVIKLTCTHDASGAACKGQLDLRAKMRNGKSTTVKTIKRTHYTVRGNSTTLRIHLSRTQRARIAGNRALSVRFH